jgi:two-component system sensor histidine kinase ResE
VEDVNLSAFINRIIYKFQGLAKENEIQIYSEVQNDVSPVLFDPDRIEQVLTNLIDNAMRHTPKGGQVKVSVVLEDRGVRMEVKDSGSGIPEEDLPFVFERFYKADKARTRGRAGTGLGLAIAKNIIDAHRGTISVRSKIGRGTTFSFYLPRKK